MNTSHFYERSALEVSDPVPWAFPCHKGKPFEGVSHVVWLLWIIDISRRPWILLISAPNAFDWFFPPPDQWTSSAGGGPPEMWPLLASPREPKDTSPQGNLLWLLHGKRTTCFQSKDFQKLLSYPSCLANCFGNRKGHCRPSKIDFLTVSARC